MKTISQKTLFDKKWVLEKQKPKTIPKTGNNQPHNLIIYKWMLNILKKTHECQN